MRIFTRCSAFLLLLVSCFSLASGPQTGPVIEAYGPAYDVPGTSLNLVPGQRYKVIMDIGQGPDDPSEMNHRIESAARFINMHAQQGIDPGDLEVALVLHGSATRNALNGLAHKARFSQPNGSAGLIAALKKAGVDIYVCGQSAAYHGFGAEELLPMVDMAVSAMTVHIRLQQEGYLPILF